MGMNGQHRHLAAFLLGKRPHTLVQEAGWATGPGFINAYKLVQKSSVYDKGQVIVFLLLWSPDIEESGL